MEIKIMIDFEKFTEEMKDSVKEADDLNGSGPDIHSTLLKIIFQDMKDSWSLPEEALGGNKFRLTKNLSHKWLKSHFD